MKTIAPFGSWASPVSSSLIASATVKIEQIMVADNHIYWIENRPAEGGRSTIVKHSQQSMTLLPEPFNARSQVHEYGGGAYLPIGSSVCFSNYKDHLLYVLAQDGTATPITSNQNFHYANGTIDGKGKTMVWVKEDHSQPENPAVNTLVCLSLDGQETELASGCDFYSSPRFNADGSKLCFLSWNNPNLPWNGTQLWLADLNDHGSVAQLKLVAGSTDESIVQPEWSPDGHLYFVSDREQFWNLYRYKQGKVEQVSRLNAEFARPDWIFGQSQYAFESSRRIICSYTQNGRWQLAQIDTETLELEKLETPFWDIAFLKALPGKAVFIGSAPDLAPSVVQLDLKSNLIDTLFCSSKASFNPGYISIPVSIEFKNSSGNIIHAFYYRPVNADYAGPADELPPLIVKSHGGPTFQAGAALNATIQFWTSRGFAFLDVNYSGSTGFGKEYRNRLNGQWGIIDVDDCQSAAKYIAEQKEVDRLRMAISGSSAGGFTTLCALTFGKTFSAGASYYGISNLEALLNDSHKFEACYCQHLVGPYPQDKEVYFNRSPINFVEKLSCPIIFFQGLSDKVVLPDQAQQMVQALKSKGLPVAYLSFAEEGHGFRQAINIKRALDAELYFYSKIFAFPLRDQIEPVAIDNLEVAAGHKSKP